MAISTYSNGIGSYASAVIRYAPYGILESPDFVNTEMMYVQTTYNDLVAAGKDVEQVYTGDISWDGGIFGSGYRIQERSMLPASNSFPVLSQCKIQYSTSSATLSLRNPIKDNGEQNPKFENYTASYTLTPLNFPWTTVDLFGNGDQWVIGGIECELTVDLGYLAKDTPEAQWRLYSKGNAPVSSTDIKKVNVGASSQASPRGLADFITSVSVQYSRSASDENEDTLNDLFPIVMYL